jgi:hypothetical protein
MMSEPTIDEIMEKAKQLCRLDGMLWSRPKAGHHRHKIAGFGTDSPTPQPRSPVLTQNT